MAREAVNILTHLLWLLLAIPAAVTLWQRCRGNRPRQWSMLVYGASMVLCAAGSTFYHLGNALHEEGLVSASLVRVLEMLDHMGIYLLIAGTTTPIVFNLLHGPSRNRFLRAVWLAALLGITARAFEGSLPRWGHAALYLGMGWGLATTAPGLARALPFRDLRLIWVGGLLYTLGAAAHVGRWPTLWPDVLGPHQFLHLFVLAGATAHFLFILGWVVPYREPAEAEPRLERARAAVVVGP